MFLTTKSLNNSKCVEPQFSLIFVPFGCEPIKSALGQSFINKLGAITEEAPFAQSTAILKSDKESIFMKSFAIFIVLLFDISESLSGNTVSSWV